MRDAVGAAGGTLAMLTPRPAGLCRAWERVSGWEGMPASPRSAPAQPIGMRALGRRPRVPGRGPAPACGPSGSALMGKPVIQRALSGMGGKRDSFGRRKCLTTSSLPGWSGAPISQANQPGKGLILGLYQVTSSLVHLCSV